MIFRNKFDKFNKTGARMLHSIDHISLKLIKDRIFDLKKSRFCHLLRNVIIDVVM